jgi:hypothetical protein
MLTWQLQQFSCCIRAILLARLALKVVIQNDRDFVDEILL